MDWHYWLILGYPSRTGIGGRMEKDRLHKFLGRIVSVTMNDGQIHIGVLGYTPSYCSRLGFNMPDGYYIGDYQFQAESVKTICVYIGPIDRN